MWKLIEISQQSYFIHCNITNSQEVTFILYDLKETWCKSLPFHEVKQNVKLLNKRYDFNEANIRDTLLNGVVQTAIIEQQPHTSSTKQESCVVKLKYLVKNCPFHLEWSLRRQTLEEFQATFMQPLFTALQGCFQQVEILTEVLRKKDAELIQYRKEGAVLHRKTLATKTFDFNDFGQKYKESTELAANYAELAKFVINTKAKVGVNLNMQPKSNEVTKDEILPEEKTVSTKNTNTKMSPKQRKRKVLEMKQQQLERQLKVRKQHFEYESSQSQTTNSQSNEETIKTEQKDLKDDKISELKQKKFDRQHKEYERSLSPSTDSSTSQSNDEISPQQKDLKDELQTTPKKKSETASVTKSSTQRRTTRCAPIRNYDENKSRDKKTDSDNDEIQSSTSQSNDETLKISPQQKDLKDELQTTPKRKSETVSVTKSTPQRKTKRCAPIRNYDENKSSDEETDSDDDENNKMTQRQRKSTRNLNTGVNETSAGSSEKSKETNDNTKCKAADSCDISSTKSPTLSYNSMKKSSGKSTPSLNDVYDFSTDSEYEKTTKTRRKLLKTSPNIIESRKTRSSPLVLNETANEQQSKSPPSSNNSPANRSKNLSHSISQGSDDISSQLDAIKKELKSLEALRLADLQQRMCKA